MKLSFKQLNYDFIDASEVVDGASRFNRRGKRTSTTSTPRAHGAECVMLLAMQDTMISEQLMRF